MAYIPIPYHPSRLADASFVTLPSVPDFHMYKTNGDAGSGFHLQRILGYLSLPQNIPDVGVTNYFLLSDIYDTSHPENYFANVMYYDSSQNAPPVDVAGSNKEQYTRTKIIQLGTITFNAPDGGDIHILYTDGRYTIYSSGFLLSSGISPTPFTASYGLVSGTGDAGYLIVPSGSGRLNVNAAGTQFVNGRGNPPFQNIPPIDAADYTNATNRYLISNSGLLYPRQRGYVDYRTTALAAPPYKFVIDTDNLKNFSVSGVATELPQLSMMIYSNLVGLSYNPSGEI